MHFSMRALFLGLVPLAFAAPLEKRALSASDESVLQLALYLEHLEFNLYSGGFNNFNEAQYEADGFPPGFRDNVGVIAQHEQTHADTITQVLSSNGVTPIPTCQYHFPYSSPKEFVALANMITTTGIGAYIGGATGLTDNDVLLTTASAILTLEARHDSYLRAGVGDSPFPAPFDTPLTAEMAYNIAHMFVVSCPQELPLVLLPKLNVTSPVPPPTLQPPKGAGTVVTFSFDPSTFFVKPNGPLNIALVNQINPPVFVPLTMNGDNSGSITLPDGLAGIAFAALTTFSGGLNETGLSDFGILAGPAEVVLS